MIFAVSLYSCIRWVTDYTKEGHYWTQSLGNSILEIVILAFVSYLFFIYFRQFKQLPFLPLLFSHSCCPKNKRITGSAKRHIPGL